MRFLAGLSLASAFVLAFLITLTISVTKSDEPPIPPEEIPEEPVEMPAQKIILEERPLGECIGAWCLTSGGYLYFKNNRACTIFGELPAGDRWQKLYAKSKPEMTDGGTRPQKIFRLLRRELPAQNNAQQAYFTVDQYITGANNNSWDGLVFYSGYTHLKQGSATKPSHTVYYATVMTQDGRVFIEKKWWKDGAEQAEYTKLAETWIAEDLLAPGVPVGLRIEKRTVGTNVELEAFIDRGARNEWQSVAKGTDMLDGTIGAPYYEGMNGIRADNFEFCFSNWRQEAL